MGSSGMFGGTMSVLEQNLDLRSIKHNLIVTNIANKDTPNYKAFDLVVEEELEKAVQSGKNMGLKATHSGHLTAGGNLVNQVRPTIVDSTKMSYEGNGNTVNIDKEMTDMAENSVLYDTVAKIISKKFRGLRNAIQGGAK